MNFVQSYFGYLTALDIYLFHLEQNRMSLKSIPRKLFGCIQGKRDVEGNLDVRAGFREWENSVLRRSPYRQEEDYLDYIENLRAWMTSNQDVFAKSANLQHLKSSLYARAFQYVYPRRVLANAYCEKHKGNVEAISAEILERQFPSSVELEVAKLKETYTAEWQDIVTDVRNNFIAKAKLYRSVLQEKVQTEQPDDSETTTNN